MSRSYKKNPCITDHKRRSTKKAKRVANKIFRRKLRESEELYSFNQHKKITESYNICDYKSRMTREEAIDWYSLHRNHDKETLEDYLKLWEKWYRRK